ncbi:MAG: hypothetical protein PVJ73_03145 [Acidobacteriota bacterium]
MLVALRLVDHRSGGARRRLPLTAEGRAGGGDPGRWGLLLTLATIAAVFWTQWFWVRSTNFGGADEWLLIDLSSRGVLAFPYANRPLVLLWTTIASQSWPHDLRAYWLFSGLYLCGAAFLTTVLARRLWPASPRLALLAGVFAVGWAPLDALRLSGVLSCSYTGFTLCTMAALTLFVESWHRRRRDLLVLAALLGFIAARGVESVIPVLIVAPLLVAEKAWQDRRRLAGWLAVWYGAVALELALALRPMLTGAPSYQQGALGLDPNPVRALGRLAQLLWLQAGPLVTSPPAELWTPAVVLAVGAFLALAAGAAKWGSGSSATAAPLRGEVLRALGVGLLLAASAHAGLALTVAIKTPSRTQILSGPGFGLALAGLIVLLSSLGPRRTASAATLALGAWVVAVGAGRTVALQEEWDTVQGVYPQQYRTLSGLVGEAPGLKPGTLVLLLDNARVWPLSFTFRHAVSYLYPGQALGLVPGGNDMLYPWSFTPAGVAIAPWPLNRGPWGVRPSFHPWDALVVVGPGAAGVLAVRPRWPEGVLPPLPPGARYAPFERIVRDGPVPASRRILRAPESDGR